eukprot:370418-Pyramimonas_sp.AAC.2
MEHHYTGGLVAGTAPLYRYRRYWYPVPPAPGSPGILYVSVPGEGSPRPILSALTSVYFSVNRVITYAGWGDGSLLAPRKTVTYMFNITGEKREQSNDAE